jgi:molybdenum cofactor cytidylyltransferase
MGFVRDAGIAGTSVGRKHQVMTMAQVGSRVSAVVLAAGRSARMGEAKQLLRVGRRTVLERTLENVRGARVDEIVLVLGATEEAIRQKLPANALEGLKIVVNEDYAEGMASSLSAGLAAVDPEINAALIVLGDQPFVRAETIDRILEVYCESGAEIVVPFYKGQRGNPVLLDRTVFAEAMALEGDTGCRAIFGSHAAGLVEANVNDEGILLDIDTRGDYERLRDLDG